MYCVLLPAGHNGSGPDPAPDPGDEPAPALDVVVVVGELEDVEDVAGVIGDVVLVLVEGVIGDVVLVLVEELG